MTGKTRSETLRELPSINEILAKPNITHLIKTYGRRVVRYAARQAVQIAREEASHDRPVPPLEDFVKEVEQRATELVRGSLRPVINATGIVLHTNLGRAPLGRAVIDEIATIASGYSNLEFDLASAHRGNRNVHARELIALLTGAEEVAVVNNNAAGILLCLRVLAQDREVIISRGELIEIGGSFRIPDIMAASGARMVEVGTTNRTRLSDFEHSLTEHTALLFKAHTSNFALRGFTEEVSVKELAVLGRKHGLPLIYDIGSGLLQKPKDLALGDEPTVEDALKDGADIVAFSCDKLLGGPQAGILAGKAELVQRLARDPLMRALRVDKMTYAALSAVFRQYLREDNPLASIPIYTFLKRDRATLDALADDLILKLDREGIKAKKTESHGQTGGGSLPDLAINSLAVEVKPLGTESPSTREHETFAEALYRGCLDQDPPVLGILREGKILFDVLALFEDDIPLVASAVATCLKRGGQT